MITSYSLSYISGTYRGNYDKFYAIVRNNSLPSDVKGRAYKLSN